MKAWNVYNKFNDDLGCEIVYAETIQEAKESANIGSMSNGVDELRAKRAKYADDKENLVEEDFLILLLEHGWQYWDYPVRQGDNFLGTVSLNKHDIGAIKDVGLEKYLMIKNLK